MADASNKLPTALRGMTITQISMLVPDLGVGVRTWSAILGVSDWAVYTYSPATVPDLKYRGEPGEYAMRLALAGSNPQTELIEPLGGLSIYHEWIDQRGYGAHHIGFHVPDAKPIVAGLAADGLLPVQSGAGYGVNGDGAFFYFDLVDELGLYAEIIELPAQRRPSEAL